MRRAICILTVGVLSCAMAARVFAASPQQVPTAPESVVYDAASAFEYLKTLAGDWHRGGMDHEHGSTARSVNFRTSAAGSNVLETIYPGSPNEMTTVFHMDGDKLLLTHYCALQNAPVMKFVPTGKPGEIKFEFLGGTNFDPKTDTHVHEGSYQVKDNNTIEATFITFADGKGRPGAKSILKKKAAE